MAINNSVNANQAGVQCLTSAGVWNGRTITAGTGISVSNGDGVSGNPTISASPSPGGLSTVYIYDDFIANISSAVGAVGNTHISSSTGSGGGAITAQDIAGYPGVLSMDCTSSANSGGGIGTASGILAGNGTITCQWVCKIPTLSDGTNRFKVRIGLSNTGQPNNNPTKGCWFEYTDNVNSGNWTIKTGGTSVTTTNTSTAADTNWHNYKIIINAGNTSASFYIDNVEVANSPVTSTLPNAGFGPQVSSARTLGNGGSVYADLYILQIDLTSARPG